MTFLVRDLKAITFALNNTNKFKSHSSQTAWCQRWLLIPTGSFRRLAPSPGVLLSPLTSDRLVSAVRWGQRNRTPATGASHEPVSWPHLGQRQLPALGGGTRAGWPSHLSLVPFSDSRVGQPRSSGMDPRAPRNIVREKLSSLLPREENDNPLQYSCLGNPMYRKEPGGLQSMG